MRSDPFTLSMTDDELWNEMSSSIAPKKWDILETSSQHWEFWLHLDLITSQSFWNWLPDKFLKVPVRLIWFSATTVDVGWTFDTFVIFVAMLWLEVTTGTVTSMIVKCGPFQWLVVHSTIHVSSNFKVDQMWRANTSNAGGMCEPPAHQKMQFLVQSQRTSIKCPFLTLLMSMWNEMKSKSGTWTDFPSKWGTKCKSISFASWAQWRGKISPWEWSATQSPLLFHLNGVTLWHKTCQSSVNWPLGSVTENGFKVQRRHNRQRDRPWRRWCLHNHKVMAKPFTPFYPMQHNESIC